MELSSSNIKKFLIFSLKKKLPLYFRKWNPAQAGKIKEIHPGKISCTSENGNPEKISYVS